MKPKIDCASLRYLLQNNFYREVDSNAINMLYLPNDTLLVQKEASILIYDAKSLSLIKGIKNIKDKPIALFQDLKVICVDKYLYFKEINGSIIMTDLNLKLVKEYQYPKKNMSFFAIFQIQNQICVIAQYKDTYHNRGFILNYSKDLALEESYFLTIMDGSFNWQVCVVDNIFCISSSIQDSAIYTNLQFYKYSNNSLIPLFGYSVRNECKKLLTLDDRFYLIFDSEDFFHMMQKIVCFHKNSEYDDTIYVKLKPTEKTFYNIIQSNNQLLITKNYEKIEKSQIYCKIF
jgi:hypothetical protein